MYEIVSSIIESVNFVLLMAMVVIGLKIFIKTKKDEELVASILFLKKQHLYDVTLLGMLGITSLSASSITSIANTFGVMESYPMLNEIFKFNSLSFLFFSAVMLHKMLKMET
jgi:hypothetical protein